MNSTPRRVENITTDKGSLAKDDRLDAVEMLARELVGFLVLDEDTAEKKRTAAEAADFINNPMQNADRKPVQKDRSGRSHRAMRRRGM